MSETGEETPGRRAIEVMKTVHKDLVFKKPIGTVRKKKKQKVLDDDTYVDEMGKIIQRDFFPDLEKLKAQNDYLEAMEKNDTIKLRQLHMKYSGKKPPSQRMPSPATFETPAHLHNQSDNDGESVINCDNNEKSEKKLSLDQYLNSHTSQDNESFEEILTESAKKHRQKYSYLYNEEEKSVEENKKLLALPSIEQQCALPEKKLDVDTWTYKNKNYIMYVPDGVELSEEQVKEINNKRQQINHTNTRLVNNPFNEVQSKETINELARTQAKVLDGKIGVDGKEILKPDTPKVQGYNFIRSPSPCPGVMDSPLMTWGEIEGTPFRLDGGDTPLPRSQGPSFKMAEPPRREQLLFALAEKVGEKNRDQKKRAIEAARRQFTTPSPRRPGTIDRLSTLSPAARKLATAKLKLGVNSDLLSSYSPSPSMKTPRTPTPRRTTTPKPNLGVKKTTTEVSTDDLLKISLPKRAKASDFF
ncbi:splicing factor ESS-2 homolog [Aethina tumida]|uniref:splicing factor ESS-2 homolog n=1 Tax=Aethina tumida TaxID=116153 RepID=UPI00214928DC|nr:splicing factor ESS-2 homolog [Aethina tumida]